MSDFRMAAGELRFADLVWENEPIASGLLAKLALETIVDPARLIVLAMGLLLSMPLRPWIHNWAKATPRRAAIAEPVTNGLTLILFVVCLLCISGSGFSPFIYFQF
jgi:hypothetical protein